MPKVTIIGATGNVGTFAAHTISEIPHVQDILLIGREGREDLLNGITQDLQDSFAACGNSMRLSWSTDIRDLRGSDIVVCTAGIPRRPGQDRLDLAVGNARLVAELSMVVGEVAPEAMFLMITNPVDVMTSIALKYSGLEPRQVFGLGTHLDSMRLKSLIAGYFKVHVSEVHTRIIGEHGLSMVRYGLQPPLEGYRSAICCIFTSSCSGNGRHRPVFGENIIRNRAPRCTAREKRSPHWFAPY